uniref:Uncharacterized protein n=1 Tax=Solanum lycopersicum TaxID=4081 RepID=A0A3Q7IDW1_SOLLC
MLADAYHRCGLTPTADICTCGAEGIMESLLLQTKPHCSVLSLDFRVLLLVSRPFLPFKVEEEAYEDVEEEALKDERKIEVEAHSAVLNGTCLNGGIWKASIYVVELELDFE